MTVLEVIQKSADFLAKKGVESPRLQAELLLAHLLKLPRMKLYLNFERTLAPAEVDALRELVRRRGRREPLQHITGSTSFCGLEISVNRHALVPRPETELLAEMGWRFLTQLSESRVPRDPDLKNEDGDSYNSSLRALDFGTGTGCIAIALAVKCPAAKITATDISADALTLASENAARHHVAEQIEFVQSDGFAVLMSEGRVAQVPNSSAETEIRDSCNSSLRRMGFDLIISNPPYIPSAEIATLQPEVRDFDPRGALDGGADGLDFYHLIASQAAAFLKPGGKVMLEFGDGQAEALRRMFANEKWVVEAVEEDYSHRARILIAKSSSSSSSPS
ncbi:MAG: peptide chain release factor N(5)-glutamine methyltransferase [Verrucomicrobiota bacterium]